MMKALVYMFVGAAFLVDVFIGWEDGVLIMLVAIVIALTNLDRSKK